MFQISVRKSKHKSILIYVIKEKNRFYRQTLCIRVVEQFSTRFYVPSTNSIFDNEIENHRIYRFSECYFHQHYRCRTKFLMSQAWHKYVRGIRVVAAATVQEPQTRIYRRFEQSWQNTFINVGNYLRIINSYYYISHTSISHICNTYKFYSSIHCIPQ